MAYLTNLGDIINQVARLLRLDRTDPEVRELITFWVNDTQMDLSEGEYPFLETTRASVSFNGSASYDLPSDFGKILAGSVVTDDNTRLKYKPIEEIDQKDADWSETGDPIYFSIYNNKIYFWPVPEEGTCYYRYYKKLTPLTEETDVPVVPQEWRELLVLGAVYRGFEWQRSAEAELYRRNYEEKRLKLMAFGSKVVGGLGDIETDIVWPS